MTPFITNGSVDWRAVREYAASLLSEYIRVDTTNPPGNEAAAVALLQKHLDGAGIPHETLAKDPARPNLIATLKGDGSKRPIILLSHTDVVAAERREWTADPFGGEVRGGAIWGRGAFDCKSLGVMHLVAMRLVRERGLALARDVKLLAVCDEEQGGAFGARWLCEAHPGRMDAEYLLGEGGAGITVPGKPGIWLPSYAEKGILWLTLTARGDGGHGSMPKRGGAVERMNRALARLYALRPQVFITCEAEAHLKTIASRVKFPLSYIFRRPRSQVTRAIIRYSAAKNDMSRALMTSTFTVSALRAGNGENLIPSACEATLDCRIHPADDPAAFRRRIEKAVAREGVAVTETLNAESTRSPVDTDLWRALAGALAANAAAKVAVPVLTPGTTDSRFFRKLGTVCYGISPVLIGVNDMEAHRADEKITLDNLELGCRVMHDTLKAVCGR